MAIEQIDIEKFLALSAEYVVLDVRSPGEYLHAHIPAALPLPLFSDEERKIIGTAYKKESRQAAVKIGLIFFSVRMKSIIPEVEKILDSRKKIKDNSINHETNRLLLHCWRGGMRSGAVAWLLDLYGFKVYTLKGGYKSFRNWALVQFEKEYHLNVLGGYTGSGKTQVLEELKKNGKTVIDLEKIANHKGSAFGALGEKPQPAQEMFENLLACELNSATERDEKQQANGMTYTKKSAVEIWIEDESMHIGTAGIPKKIWGTMRRSSLYFLDIPFDQRLKYIVSSYGVFNKKDLADPILRIQKRLGGLETKNALKYLEENDLEGCFSILLRYYDKMYNVSLYNRENIDELLHKIPCETVGITNAQKFCSQNA
ncbi:MAG: tRNA 2-selenouridine(34) synthase MnmH [Ginsengibacter sp.]